MEIAILNVNKKSSTNGGRGNTIIAKIIIINTGPAKVLRLFASIKDEGDVMALFISFLIKRQFLKIS
jgi:hypothetical protein